MLWRFDNLNLLAGKINFNITNSINGPGFDKIDTRVGHIGD